MKKIYKINLFKVPGGVLRRSVLHQLSFYTKIVAYILGKLKPNKKKVKIDNTGLNKKLKKIMDEWLSKQTLANEIRETLNIANYDPTTPAIESFKMNVDQYGFLHGYYLKAV